jgi:hypothetical protein
MKFLTMTTMLLGDVIPSHAYIASTVIAIGGVRMPSSTRRIISTSLSSREILRSLSPLYDGFGGRDDAHNSMPSNDEIATQEAQGVCSAVFVPRDVVVPSRHVVVIINVVIADVVNISWPLGQIQQIVVVVVVKARGVLVVH